MHIKRIRLLREQKKYTQKQIAIMLTLPLTTYNNYELGIRDIPYEIFIQLADIYQVSTDYLLERTDNPTMNL